MSTVKESTRAIRVAAVQAHACLGQTHANLERYLPLVEQGARQGAQLVALPELAAPGYSMSPAIWDVAEARRGPTVRWLQDTAQRFGVYLGIGFAEADGNDIYNTYALSAPAGQVAGFVRKTMAETACFRTATGPHVIETEIGKIGVGICADNLVVPNLHRMQDYGADLLLMPHAAPLPFRAGGAVKEKDLPEARETMRQMAPRYARLIGIPTLFINQVGPRGREKWFGIFGAVMSPDQWRLGGLSTIADQDGRVLGHMDEQTEGVLVADVVLDESRKIKPRPVGHGTYGGGFVIPHPWLFEAICYEEAARGWLVYALSAERRRKARLAASNGRA